ncbi:alpha/beta fold hydrolase [Lentzea sp. BCCO 10_0856]|uniref:Alpha/beta fold hydrolase n=1 Tax=Lentzea miocenica TaxID=3095431 RepID=A0ABU4T9R9_9PSEU|nr:alpha/beta fold hydrolase [Lentzea sp. BCCO 10_0856]MDX8034658.1 alpha/beta fold hydrolase [Lentzea sp. BCCO 10_0856]
MGHGFTNNVQKPYVSRVLARLATHAGVVAFDFRGHGRSEGKSTVGADEIHDVEAGVLKARELGYSKIATVGFSMGASIVVRHAALAETRPDAVVSVSGPARWWSRETAPMRRVHWLLEQPHGKLAARAMGVRLGESWVQPPESPLEVVARITPTPLLIVHGDLDHYFGPEHAMSLHRASLGHAELWIEKGMRHAESAATPDLVDRMAAWIAGNVEDEE